MRHRRPPNRAAGIYGLALAALILLQGCSGPPNEQAPPPPPPPTTGSVELTFVKQKSGEAISGLTVYLCEAGEESKCTLRAAFTGTTDDGGVLRLKNVAPGRYVVTLAGAPDGQIEDGRVIDFATNFRILPGSAMAIMDGKLIVTGGVQDPKSKLRVIASKGQLSGIDVRAGSTATGRIEVPAGVLR